MKNVVLALDLGGTKLSSAIFEANGKIRQKKIVPLAKRTGKQVGALIGKQIEQSIAKAEPERLKISAIGCVALDFPRRRVWRPVGEPICPSWGSF